MQHHVIIGGGLIGLFTAYYLRKAGEQVTILEKGEFGRESSWAGGGILSPLYPWRYPTAVNDLAHWSQIHYPQIVDDLSTVSGIDPEYNACGMLTLDNDEIEQAVQWANNYATHIELVDKAKVIQTNSNLNIDILRGKSIWLPNIAQVRNPRLVKALLVWLQRNKVSLHSQSEVNDFTVDSNKVCRVTANTIDLQADNFVIASGAWSNELLQKLNINIPLEPVRGQMLMFRAEPGLIDSIILKQDHYLIPRLDGRILVGSTLEHVGFNKQTTDLAYQQLLEFALDVCPVLANFPIEAHWSGLRPGSSNSIPKICKHPFYTNLFINTGHFRNGVVTAPSSAQIIHSLILNKKSILDPKPYTF